VHTPERGATPEICGVDFTSAPRRGKPITVAYGVVSAAVLRLRAVEVIETFAEFERWLERPGPWVCGFDFPFGLPREAVRDLGWPQAWPALVRHCTCLGREAFRSRLDVYRAERPSGRKYPYRRGDLAAGSHSPIKLVNPPVALMFLEGAARLANAGVHVPSVHPGDPSRVAVEAYPAFAVRRLFASRVRLSYKNDAKAKQTAAQHALRSEIVRRMSARDSPIGVTLDATVSQREALIGDASGDRLDAVVCALQAAWAWRRRASGYGLPPQLDPLEGWIATVPG
jgi:hypothetical protein